MPTWKKVIVSGSQAHLAAVTASVHLAGTNQIITTNPSTTILSGSFSGSFQGSINATITNAVTASVTSVTDTNTNAAHFITFKAASTGHPTDLVDSNGLIYNPSNNSVTSSIFRSDQTSGVGFVGTASYALVAPYSGLTGVPAGIVSASNFTSTAQGSLTASINGVATNVDLGLEISDSPSFVAVVATNPSFTLAGAATTVTVGGASSTVTIPGNLTVNGTTTIINTDNLLVEDKFILLASGSTTALTAVGGIVVQNAANSTGSAFIWKGADNRWAVVPAVGSTDADATVNSYLVTVSGSNADPAGDPIYGNSNSNRIGAMYVNTSTQDIWIWS